MRKGWGRGGREREKETYSFYIYLILLSKTENSELFSKKTSRKTAFLPCGMHFQKIH